MRSKTVASPYWVQARISKDACVSEYCSIHHSIVGAHVIVKERVSLKRCLVGLGAQLNAGSYFENVRIGRYAQIGPNCTLAGIWHIVGAAGPHLVHTDPRASAIVIGAGTLIGGNVTIAPGVTIGKRCVVGAASLVTKNLADDMVYWGHPPHPTLMTREEYLLRKAK